jgi:hypothetical protein
MIESFIERCPNIFESVVGSVLTLTSLVLQYNKFWARTSENPNKKIRIILFSNLPPLINYIKV